LITHFVVFEHFVFNPRQYAVAYHPVTRRKRPRLEVWPEPLTLGKPLPFMPLWLSLDLSVPVHLEGSYRTT